MDALTRFATALFAALAESAPYLVVGYLLVALIREFVPPATLTRHLGGRGIRPLLNALGIGALLPVCSCGSIPLGVGLYRSGGAVGTVLTLMTSSPAISPVSLALGYTLLGPQLLMTLVGVVLVGSFAVGLVANLWLHEPTSDALPVVESVESVGEGCCETNDREQGSRFGRAFRWAYWDLGADVSLDLLIGLTVAAAVIAFVPAEWTSQWLGQQSTWAMLCVILISIPMYTCSVPAMLIANSFLLTGAGPGAAVAFLVAGPASNLGELNAIRGSMGNRAAAYYSVALVLVALIGGMVTDHVVFANGSYIPPVAAAGSLELGAESGDTPQRPGSLLPALDAHHVPAWHYPFIVVLVAVMVLGVVRRLGRPRNGTHAEPTSRHS